MLECLGQKSDTNDEEARDLEARAARDGFFLLFNDLAKRCKDCDSVVANENLSEGLCKDCKKENRKTFFV